MLGVREAVADAQACIGMMRTGKLCVVTNDRSRLMSPMPARATVVGRLVARFSDLGVTKVSVAKDLAEAAVDICLPQLHPRSCGGVSLLDRMWEEADTVMDRLALNPDNDIDRGALQNACYFIAIVQNPYKPNINTVKAEVRRRWEEGQEEDE